MIYLISDLYNEMIELYTCETYISIHWGIVDFLQLSEVLAGQPHDPVVQLVLLVTQGHHGGDGCGGDGFNGHARLLVVYIH